MASRILTLRMKARWWNEIASGSKSLELRLRTDHWNRFLADRTYDEIHLWCGYPPKSRTDLLLRRKWVSVTACDVVHEEFGPDPVAVWAIDVSVPVDAP